MSYNDLLEEKLEERRNKIEAERAELIRMCNVKLNEEEDILKTLFMSNVMKARYRNKILDNEFQKILNEAKTEQFSKKDDKSFMTLKKNYWSMVKAVYPIWLADLENHRRQKNAIAIQQSNYDEQFAIQRDENSNSIVKSLENTTPNIESQSQRTTSHRQIKKRSRSRKSSN